MRFSIAAASASVVRMCSWSWSVSRHGPPAGPTMGTIALPVMSPPMIRTSALWNAPALRNLRQHTSDPWMSVAKKMRTRRLRQSLVVAHFLGLDVPLLALANPRPEPPSSRLRRVVDRRPQGFQLGARVEQDRPLAADVHVLRGEVRVEVLLQDVEVAGHRPPPAPVVRGEGQDSRQADRGQ